MRLFLFNQKHCVAQQFKKKQHGNDEHGIYCGNNVKNTQDINKKHHDAW